MRTFITRLALTASIMLAYTITAYAEQNTSKLEVKDAWVRETVGNLKTSAAYVSLQNNTKEPIILTSAHSPFSNHVAIHQTIQTEEGIMQMIPLHNLTIPAGKTVEMKPGAIHIMLMQLTQTLKKGEVMPLRLVFENHPPMELKAPVKPLGNAH